MSNRCPIMGNIWGSTVTCTELLVYGDGIEFVAKSLPVAPSIPNLGHGIQYLHEASQKVKQTDGTRIQKSIESLILVEEILD
ncbi:hypothetical protein Patl1_14704 [Pistacia atlantica]|uniref:Uncharacterized protein n=1 Tax=Pistacia atlantica TaxID=434234 RepID=A0ACC1ATP3_9ROSI|nr:hypothetical protein Patl1_14704 [Pistacia atlantica]